MRRSAAALLARTPAPPPTPTPEGLEGVRAAAAAAMQAVDAKLAAVRFTVSGGRAAAPVVPLPGSGAVQALQGMRRSGSEPELLGCMLGRVSAAAEPGLRERGRPGRRSSCPSLVAASVGSFPAAGLQAAASPTHPMPPSSRMVTCNNECGSGRAAGTVAAVAARRPRVLAALALRVCGARQNGPGGCVASDQGWRGRGWPAVAAAARAGADQPGRIVIGSGRRRGAVLAAGRCPSAGRGGAPVRRSQSAGPDEPRSPSARRAGLRTRTRQEESPGPRLGWGWRGRGESPTRAPRPATRAKSATRDPDRIGILRSFFLIAI